MNTMKTLRHSIMAIFLIIVTGAVANAQQVVRLYENKPPGSENWTQKETEFTHPKLEGLLVRNVTDPTLTVFKPDNPNGMAIIVCPGGGFHWLAYQSEGTEVAKWLSARGITAFVLKYRLVNTGPTMADFEESYQDLMSAISSAQKSRANHSNEAMPAFPKEMFRAMTLATADGIRAIKYVRQHADKYSIDENNIGMIGFSAGSGVELEVIMNGEPASMPNFAAHIYGGDTRGRTIPENAPPLFILSAADDDMAASTELFNQWRAAGKSAELHVYSKGGHSFGMKEQGLPVDSWIDRFGDWLQIQDE